MGLSSNVPDPSFPPVPPQDWPTPNVYGGAPTFSDLGHTEPLVDQPITLEPVAHTTTVAPIGGDPLTETPQAPGTPLSDQRLTETSKGADYS